MTSVVATVAGSSTTLALNGPVGAARSGETDSGPAVVVDEVQACSDGTEAATDGGEAIGDTVGVVGRRRDSGRADTVATAA